MGILKYNQALSPDLLKKMKDNFVSEYLSITNTGGIAAVDSKLEYQPLKNEQSIIDVDQVNAVKEKIYNYLGISESIVNSSYTEDEWAAFYESVIEPLALQMSLELTSKLFTDREKAYGNSIMFESNRLQFASNATKTNLLKEIMPLGLLTINQALEILNMPGVEDGDKRVQTLNVVNTAIVDKYQMKEGKENEGK